MKKFDIVIIGAGPSGISVALRAARQGAYVCIVEQDKLGGSCFRKGIYPIKAALANLGDINSDVFKNESIDIDHLWQSVANSMNSISLKWESTLKGFGVVIKPGIAIPISPTLVQIKTGEKNLEINTKSIVLATGSYPVSIPTIPFESDDIISVDDVFQNIPIPKSVLILGRGGNSCELARLYRQLGSKVFLSNEEERLLLGNDLDIMNAAENSIKKLKIKLLLSKKITSYYKNNGIYEITMNGGVKFDVEKIIQNLDREGCSLNLNCKILGIRIGEHKEILVNENLETSVKGIYAVGSVTGRVITPTNYEEEGRIVSDNALGKNKVLNLDLAPFIIFTDPQIASVGCFAEEAHHKGFRAVEGKVEFKTIDFALINNNTEGFFKIVADVRSGAVIGGQIVSPNASHLISMVLLAIKRGIKVSSLASLVCDQTGEIQGIKEAASACNLALKQYAKTP